MKLYYYIVGIKSDDGKIIKIGKCDKNNLNIDAYAVILEKSYDSLICIYEVDKISVEINL